MLGRTPGNIVAVRPLRQGVISDYTVTEKMMKYFIQKAVGKKSFRKPLISVCVPSGVTEVEKKPLRMRHSSRSQRCKDHRGTDRSSHRRRYRYFQTVWNMIVGYRWWYRRYRCYLTGRYRSKYNLSKSLERFMKRLYVI